MGCSGGDGGLWGWYEFCVCFLNCRWQVLVQLIWVVVGCGLWAVIVAVVVVGCGGDGRWWWDVVDLVFVFIYFFNIAGFYFIFLMWCNIKMEDLIYSEL